MGLWKDGDESEWMMRWLAVEIKKESKKDTVQKIEEESKCMQIYLTGLNSNCMGWLLVSATIISISSEGILYSCM